jgi:adenylate cyclase
MKEVQFKGINHSVILYDVTGMRGKYNIFLPEKKMDTFTKLNSPLPIECFSLEGKTLSEKAISGHIIHLGTKAAKVTLERSVKAYENFRVQLGGRDASNTSEAYGKVLPQDVSDSALAPEMVLLQFTWLSEEAKKIFKEARQKTGPM